MMPVVSGYAGRDPWYCTSVIRPNVNLPDTFKQGSQVSGGCAGVHAADDENRGHGVRAFGGCRVKTEIERERRSLRRNKKPANKMPSTTESSAREGGDGVPPSGKHRLVVKDSRRVWTRVAPAEGKCSALHTAEDLDRGESAAVSESDGSPLTRSASLLDETTQRSASPLPGRAPQNARRHEDGGSSRTTICTVPEALSTTRTVRSGVIINLMQEFDWNEADLWTLFHKLCQMNFQRFAQRSILDCKIGGEAHVQLEHPFDILNPVVHAMTELAHCTLRQGEKLALLQVIVNYFKDGGDEVRSHYHRCRQICFSLGAPRDIHVRGKSLHMGFGDALHLAGEEHSVPRSDVKEPRVSVCLFYGSTLEYENESLSVNAQPNGLFGDSFWWNHPNSLREKGGRRRTRKF